MAESQGKGQGKKRKRKKGNKPYTSVFVQQFLSRLASSQVNPVRPVAVGPPRSTWQMQPQPPTLQQKMQLRVRPELRLVMTPKLRFKSDDEIEETIRQGLVLDPSKVG